MKNVTMGPRASAGRLSNIVQRLLRVRKQHRKAESATPPQSLGRFELQTALSRDTLGVTYRARDTSSNELVALRIFCGNTMRERSAAERLLRQLKLLAGLRQPNLLRVLESGSVQNRLYAVTELIDGEALQDRLDRTDRIGEAQTIEIARSVAEVLCYAHRAGLAHFGLNPRSLLLPFNGGLKVADLGVAHAAFGPTLLPQSGEVVGMPYYLSPEQARGDKRLDPRADFFALGAILYHMVVGKPPFQAQTGLDVFVRKLSADPLPNPRNLNPGLSDGIVRIIMKLMAKDPAARYPSAVLLIDDLNEVSKGAPALHTSLDIRRSSIFEQSTKAPRTPEQRERSSQLAAFLASLAAVVRRCGRLFCRSAS